MDNVLRDAHCNFYIVVHHAAGSQAKIITHQLRLYKSSNKRFNAYEHFCYYLDTLNKRGTECSD